MRLEPPAPGRHAYLVLLAVVWGGVLWMVDESFSRIAYAFTPDSAVYIESARHLREGRGFPRAYLWEPSPVSESPPLNRAFPPGYSLAIASLALLGVDEPSAAVAIGRTSAFLAPIVLFLLFRCLVPEGVMFALALSVALSPGFVQGHFRALADFPYLLLAIASIGLFATRDGVRSAVLSGALAGCAYWLRNVGIALLLALPVAVSLLVLLSANHRTG